MADARLRMVARMLQRLIEEGGDACRRQPREMFDLHVHAAPDIVPRRADERQVLEWYREAGFSGCALKAHYDCTAGRTAAGTGPDLAVYGGQALNQHVGGINPAAVAAALALGARVIWMPTADARGPGLEGMARSCARTTGLAPTTFAIPPVDWSTADAARAVIALVAEADAVLATAGLDRVALLACAADIPERLVTP